MSFQTDRLWQTESDQGPHCLLFRLHLLEALLHMAEPLSSKLRVFLGTLQVYVCGRVSSMLSGLKTLGLNTLGTT